VNNTAKSNPFTASTTGFWQFFADDGSYDVRISGSCIPVTYTLPSLRISAAASSSCANPTDYGAILDDGLDDYDAFVAALAANTHICLSTGTYSLDTTFAPGQNGVVTGEGHGKSTIEWIGATSGLVMYAPGGTGRIDGITIDGKGVAGVNGIRGDAAVAGAKPYGSRWGSYEIKNTPGVALELRGLTTSGSYYNDYGNPYINVVGTGIKMTTSDGVGSAFNNANHFGTVRIGTCTTGVDMNFANGNYFDYLVIEACTTGVTTGANQATFGAFGG
jgi:hypothetical protein